jgi:tRNA 2-thiocytidine biosynthesis protein TtcA
MSQPNPDKLTFYLLKNVNKAIREFDMIADGDRVAVAVSGGKDSRALLHLLRARQRAAPERYDLVALNVEAGIAGYTPLRPVLEPWFRELAVDYAFAPLELSPDEPLPLDCFRCAWHRRKALFLKAHELSCNKLAFGHHADDAAYTTLLNLFYGGRLETMAPRGEFFDEQITLIRPLIYVEERRLSQLARALGLVLAEGTCPLSHTSRRAWIKNWLRQTGPEYRQIRTNLWRAAHQQGGLEG